MTCEECLHYEVCSLFTKADGANHEYYTYANLSEKCECFKDKSEWVHLPCKVGDTVYEVTSRHTISEYRIRAVRVELFAVWLEWEIEKGFVDKSIDGVVSDEIGKTVFLAREEAEKTLGERKENDNAQIH